MHWQETHRIQLASLILVAGLLAGCTTDEPLGPQDPAVVGPKGGTLVFESGDVQIKVPPGALDQDTRLTVVRREETSQELGSPIYEFGPSETTFDVPVEVRIAVGEAGLGGRARVQHLTAGVLVDGEWQGIPYTWFDPDRSDVVFFTDRFGAPEVASVESADGPSVSKASIVLRLGSNPAPGGAPTCQTIWYSRGGSRFAARLPYYVDLNLGSDTNPGTLALPWRTVTNGAANVPTGARLVVVGPGTYEAGETFPIVLRPNVIITGEGGPVLRRPATAPLTPIFEANAEPSYAYVSGLGLGADEVAGARPRAALVTGGAPLFESIVSEETFGFRFSAGDPGLVGCTLEDWAANVTIDGGSPRLIGNNLDGTLSPPAAPRPAVGISAGDRVCLEANSFRNVDRLVTVGSPDQVLFIGNDLRSGDIAVRVFNAGSTFFHGNSFRSVDTAIFVGDENNPPNSDLTLQSNDFRHTSLGVGIATTGIVNVRSGNQWNGSDTPNAWYGPSPWIEGADIAWLLSSTGPQRWWELSGLAPPGRFGASMGYDARTDRIILFGGRSAGTNLDDTWEFDFNRLAWNGPLFPITSPPARFDAAMTRAAAGGVDNRCFLFGGHTATFPLDTAFDDLWVYDAVAADWSLLAPAGNPGDGRLPLPRYAATFVRMDDDHFVLHGGMNFGGMPMLDTWEYDAAANQWTDLTDNSNLPPSRGFHAAIDGGVNRPRGMIVLGGQTTGGPLVLEPWNFGSRPASWWEVLPTTSDPPPLSQANFEWLSQSTAPAVDRLLLLGGTDGNVFLDQNRVYTIDLALGTMTWSTLELPRSTPRPPARGRYASMSWSGPNGMRVLVFGGTAGAAQGELGDTWVLMEGGAPAASSLAHSRTYDAQVHNAEVSR